MYQYPLKAVSLAKKSRIREILSVEDCKKLSEIQDAVTINFHATCLSKYEHKLFYADRMFEWKKACSRNNWANRRRIHEKSFADIVKIVTEKLVDDRQVYALRNVYQQYLSLCAEYSKAVQPQLNHASYSKIHFCNQLLIKLPVLTKTIFKNQTFLHRDDLSVSELMSTAFHAEEALSQIKSVAFEIRRAIMKQPKRSLPKHNISIENIYEGECDVPANLYTLINCIVKGPKDSPNEKREIRIKSICDSIIYSTSCGALKPSTSLSLGLVTKSITGSRKMVEILNRLGHCVNYTCVEELETEIAYGCAADTKILPYGLVPKTPQLRTHVAFDNYDRFVETSSGRDTLHDTVGIVYQNIVRTNDTDIGTVLQPTEVDHQRRRRKYHSALDSEIVPYVRVPKHLPNLVGAPQMIPENLQEAVNLNVLWMLYHDLGIDGATRWFEWNSKRIIDTNPIQNIGYLPNLNASPTSDSVVMRTLQTAVDIADECQQKYIVVTYDLAIASKAYKIRTEMAPRFDRTFIALGSFHTELSFFKVKFVFPSTGGLFLSSNSNRGYNSFSQVIGKFIDSSGLPKLMVDSNLLADGSVRGFLSGTHFNRCKKLHPVIALSLKMLHFEFFWKMIGQNETHMNELIEILEADSVSYETTTVAIPMLTSILDKYNQFVQDTLDGKHGRTAQFALMYVSLVELYQLLERGIRTSEVGLFNYATHEICALFFAFNHQNYARWLTRNHDDFANIEQTHPGLLDDFKSGALSIRRTSKNFCRTPIDLTLEQTINADAANKLSGITAFTNNFEARQRWSETHTARTAIISNFMQFLQLTRCDESGYLSTVFARQVKTFVGQVSANINPFNEDLNPHELFNLSTGKAASSDTAEFLLNARSMGAKQRDQFIEECKGDTNRFERPIKRNKVSNFAAENIKHKHSTVKTTDDASVERNVLGHILFCVMENRIDLSNVLSYPLTTVPHSLANSDGTMISNHHEGELTSLLRSKNDMQESISQDFEVEIIDGFYYISKLGESPTKYGQFAKFLLKRLCDTRAFEIHLIFEKDEISSIKDIDVKNKVLENPKQYEIKGPNQERDAALSKCLHNPNFKKELVNFLLNHWADDPDCNTILGEKRVFVSYGRECYLYSKDYMRKKIVKSLENDHIEFETKVILHLQKIVAKNVLIIVSSTDALLVYLLYHMQFWQTSRTIWVQTGDHRKNNMQMISVDEIFGRLSRVLISALPAWFVFSGCSYEPSFYGKGRKKNWKILEKNTQFQVSFGNIGTSLTVSQTDVEILEQYTCELYNTNVQTINEARLKFFENSYKNSASKGKLQDFSKKGNKISPILFRQIECSQSGG